MENYTKVTVLLQLFPSSKLQHYLSSFWNQKIQMEAENINYSVCSLTVWVSSLFSASGWFTFHLCCFISIVKIWGAALEKRWVPQALSIFTTHCCIYQSSLVFLLLYLTCLAFKEFSECACMYFRRFRLIWVYCWICWCGRLLKILFPVGGTWNYFSIFIHDFCTKRNSC